MKRIGLVLLTWLRRDPRYVPFVPPAIPNRPMGYSDAAIAEAVHQSCRSIRDAFWSFGYDLSDLTDDELIEGAWNAAEVFAQMGIPSEEAAESLRAIFTAGEAEAE